MSHALANRIECPLCGRYVAKTRAGSLWAHRDGKCECPIPRPCRGGKGEGSYPFVCDFKTTGELCVTKLYPKRQLPLFSQEDCP